MRYKPSDLFAGRRKKLAKFINQKRIYVSFMTELELFGKQNLSKKDFEIIEKLLANCFVTELNLEIKTIYRELKQKVSDKTPGCRYCGDCAVLGFTAFNL